MQPVSLLLCVHFHITACPVLISSNYYTEEVSMLLLLFSGSTAQNNTEKTNSAQTQTHFGTYLLM